MEKMPIEKINKTQVTDILLEKNKAIQEIYLFDFNGRECIGFPNVFSPEIFQSPSVLNSLPMRDGEEFLEIGSGTGIFSIQAALAGASRVTAVDINPDAVENTRQNVLKHGLTDRVDSYLSDIFSNIPQHSLFDTIFWSIPFCHRSDPSKQMSFLERAVFDPEHELLRRFLEGGKSYLKAGGRMLLNYSTSHGDIEVFHHYASEYGWRVKLVNQVKKDFISVELYELK